MYTKLYTCRILHIVIALQPDDGLHGTPKHVAEVLLQFTV